MVGNKAGEGWRGEARQGEGANVAVAEARPRNDGQDGCRQTGCYGRQAARQVSR